MADTDKREWAYTPGDITSRDLDIERRTSGDDDQIGGQIRLSRPGGRLGFEDEAETASFLYLPSSGRLGIAWGADATWADVESLEQGIEMWVNDPDAWEEAN